MAAPVGNRFWMARTKHGKDKLFTSEDILWDAAVEYFEWAEDNPLWENKATHFQGVPLDLPSAKMRAMTIEGLCLFLDISTTTWYEYCKNVDYADITSKIDNVIRSQKFAGAAADLLNANIIARDLGLKDASTKELSGPGGVPISITDMTTSQLDAKLKELIHAIE